MTQLDAREDVSEAGLSILVVLEILAIFVVSPMTQLGYPTLVLEFSGACLVLVAAIAILRRNRTAVVIVLMAFTLGMLTSLLRRDDPSKFAIYVDFVAKLVFLLSLTWVIAFVVFGPGRVTLHRVRGAIAIYLQIAFIFAYSYLLLVRVVPNAFAPIQVLRDPQSAAPGGYPLVYFSLVTLTSTGYGDIVPVHPVARSLATLEALIGQLFPTIVLARLVTLELEGRRHGS